MYSADDQIKFKASVLRSSLCNHSDAFTLAEGTITVPNTSAGPNNGNKKVMFKNCAPFTDGIRE